MTVTPDERKNGLIKIKTPYGDFYYTHKEWSKLIK